MSEGVESANNSDRKPGSSIEPAEYAVSIVQTEVEAEVDSLPPQNPQLQGNLKALKENKP